MNSTAKTALVVVGTVVALNVAINVAGRLATRINRKAETR